MPSRNRSAGAEAPPSTTEEPPSTGPDPRIAVLETTVASWQARDAAISAALANIGNMLNAVLAGQSRFETRIVSLEQREGQAVPPTASTAAPEDRIQFASPSEST